MVRLIRFAVPVAAVFCVSAFAPFASAADSKSSRKSRTSESARKKSSASKKSAKSRKATRSSKSKNTAKRGRAPVVSNDWIEQLPEVELPTDPGPPEDELLERVQDSDQP
jgi:phage repressor protein C with HTH and peptisase S24 domain